MDIYSYFLNRENGSDYLTSYISYDHVNFIVPEHKRYELMDNWRREGRENKVREKGKEKKTL